MDTLKTVVLEDNQAQHPTYGIRCGNQYFLLLFDGVFEIESFKDDESSFYFQKYSIQMNPNNFHLI